MEEDKTKLAKPMGWLLKTMNSVDGVEVDCLRSTVRGDLSKDSKDCVADFNGDAAGLVSGGSAGESPDCFGVVDMEGIDGEKEVRGLVWSGAMETGGAFWWVLERWFVTG